jgi:hypothetical protein
MDRMTAEEAIIGGYPTIKIRFFHNNPSNIDPAALQTKFAHLLQKYCTTSYQEVASELFKDLHIICKDPVGSNVVCPFPLISSLKSIHNHAKKIGKATNCKSELCLGQCQLILANYYNYDSWGTFMRAVSDHYGKDEFAKVEKVAKKIHKKMKTQLQR